MNESFSEKTEPSRYRKLLPYIALAILLSLTVWKWRFYENLTVEREQRRFAEYVDRTGQDITGRLERYEMVLRGGAGVFAASEEVTREEWQAYYASKGVGFCKVVQPSELERHVQEIRAEGYPDYRVWPAGEREVYVPVIFLEPFNARNQHALGYDIISEPVRRAAVERARDTGAVSMSARVTLVTETDEGIQPGFLMYLPIYSTGMPLNSVEERRAATQGYVSAAFHMHHFMQGIFPDGNHKIAFELYDGAEVSPATLMYHSHVIPGNPGDNHKPMFTSKKTLDLFGQQWTLASMTMPAFEAAVPRYISNGILAAGGLISLLMFAFLKMLENIGDRALVLARGMTSALRESENRYGQLAVQSRTFTWEVDMRGMYTFVSPVVETVLGYRPEELVGKKHFFDLVPAEDRDRKMEFGMAILLNEETLVDFENPALAKDGRVVWVLSNGIPLRGKQGEMMGFRGSNADITQRKQAEDALRASDQRQNHMLSVSPAVIYSLRPNDFAVTWVSPNVIALLGYTAGEALQPGWWAECLHPEDRDQARADSVKVQAGSFDLEYRVYRKDGSVRWVRDRQRLLRDASNNTEEIIGVWTDITEHKQDEEAREAMVEMLRICNMAVRTRELMRELTVFFQRFSGCEAVGVRLQEGNDFPYYETRGLSEEFLQAENNLCVIDQSGELQRDHVGHPALDCMCGNVLCGRFDPSEPFFTPRGSFWSSHTSELLASTTEANRQAKTRNRCNGEGYESVALIPFRLHGETFGLFQFNDRRRGRFTAEKIAQLEHMVDYVAIALAKLKTEEALEESSQFNQQIINSAGEGVIVYDRDLRYQVWNPYMENLMGMPANKILGKHPQEIFPCLRDTGLIERLEMVMAGKAPAPIEYPVNSSVGGFSGWCLDTSAPLLNAKGEIIGVIGTVKDITEHKRYEEQLQHMATHDELTGLANRALVHDRLEQSIYFAQRSHRVVAVLLLDLDRFKVINDSLGHAFGDQLLCAVAQRLRQAVREADTVARLGGDEFVIVLAEVAEVDDVGLVAAKILRQLAAPYQFEGREVTVTASLGVSFYPRDSDNGATLIRNADMAMYQAKRDGSGISFYAPEMNQRVIETLELESALRHALERSEFCLHYQPKIDLASGRMVGCEALVRWRHPQRGMVSPADFIPLAEETGLIVPLGTWVLQEACRQAKAWQAAGLSALIVSVNLSARQFRKGDLPQILKEVLDEAGLEARWLDLELTESMVMKDPIEAEQTMRALKDMGVGLSLDDFGTGYSSLNYLRRFPVDSLKIDRSFIRDVATDPSGASVVTSVIAIAHNLGLTAVAEGVETREQLDFLAGCGCDMFQGYLFSKPLAVEEFAELLRDGRRLTSL